MFRLLPLVLLGLLISVVTPARASNEDEVKATFSRFVEFQNARDESGVAGIVRDSPDFLWVTTTAVTVWGHDAAMQRFLGNWKGTWRLEPQLQELRVVEIGPGMALLHTPLMFTFAPPGKEAHPVLIKWSGVFVRTDAGCRIASILLATVP